MAAAALLPPDTPDRAEACSCEMNDATARAIRALGLNEQQVFADIPPDLLLTISDIAPNDYNPKSIGPARDRACLQIAHSLRKHAWLPHDLALVWEDPDGATRYTIINGEHRWQVCKAAGFERFPAVVRPPFASRDDAIALVMALEGAKGRRDNKKFTANLLALAVDGKDDELRSILNVRDPAGLRLLAQQRQQRLDEAQGAAAEQRRSAPRLVSLTFTGAQYDEYQAALGKARTRLKQAAQTNALIQSLAEATDAELIAAAAVITNGKTRS